MIINYFRNFICVNIINSFFVNFKNNTWVFTNAHVCGGRKQVLRKDKKYYFLLNGNNTSYYRYISSNDIKSILNHSIITDLSSLNNNIENINFIKLLKEGYSKKSINNVFEYFLLLKRINETNRSSNYIKQKLRRGVARVR